MIDFGFDKIALIGAVALIVIGPEKLPKVARTVGHLVGRAQRYVADVKAEVNRSIELDELKKMKTQFEEAARDVESTVNKEIREHSSELENSWDELNRSSDAGAPAASDSSYERYTPPPPSYRHPKKNWRLKRAAMPRWYKQRNGVRTQVQSAAARVARHRPLVRK